MRIALLAAAVALSTSAYGLDQTAVIDGSGQKVVLHDNRTWDVAPDDSAPKPAAAIRSPADAVDIYDTTLAMDTVDYRDAVTLKLSYKNKADKKIIGIRSHVFVKNAFGKVILDTFLDDEVGLMPGELAPGPGVWHWDDNHFIKGEPYDRMAPSVSNNTAVVKVDVVKVIFEDGTVLQVHGKTSTPSQK